MAEANDIKEFKNVPKLIPEIAYDFISRLIPGAIIVVCILWLFKKDLTQMNFDWLNGLFVILVAYVIGFVIDTILNYALQRVMIRYSWEVIVDSFSDLDELCKLAATDIPQPTNGEVEQMKDNSQAENDDEKKKILRKIDYEKSKRIAEKLREHVVTNHPYATWMMPKLNAEAALPRNLGVGLIVVMIMGVYCKFSGLICREWSLLLDLLPILIVVEILLVFARKHRFNRTIKRTVYWWEELQKRKPIDK